MFLCQLKAKKPLPNEDAAVFVLGFDPKTKESSRKKHCFVSSFFLSNACVTSGGDFFFTWPVSGRRYGNPTQCSLKRL